MRDLVLMSRDGNFQELLIDYNLESFEVDFNINDDRDLSFEIPITERNELVYNKMLPDMIIDWHGQYYTIISCDEELKGNQRVKVVECKHVFMESQFIYIEKDFSKDKINDDDINTDDDGIIQDDEDDNGSIDDDFTDSNIDVVAEKVYNFLTNRGMPDYQIYGILGNMKAESNMDPAAEQVPNDPDRGGKGLVQWDDRKYNLYDYAEQENKTWQDPDLQIQFMWYELNGSESDAYTRLRKTSNTKDATLIFHRFYERSADTPEMEKRRVTYALDYQKRFEESGYHNDEVANSDFLDLSKGINFGFGEGGSYEEETGAHRHDGIDVNYIYEPVYSVVKGTVKVGFDAGGYGNYVLIDAGNGLEVIYAHLNDVYVSERQQVYTGTELGMSGNSGFSTGAHLHFELRMNGKAFDPMDWLEQNRGGTSGGDDDTGGNNGGTTEESQDLYSVQSYLDYGFAKNSLGFTYEIIGNFEQYKEVEKIGDKNLLEHIVDGAEIFGYIYFADNKHIKIYDNASFYELEDEPIVYQYNSDELTVKTSITGLETYIQGYGGKKSTAETKNYNPIRVKDLQYKGTFDKNGTWSTEQVGAYYTSNFNAKHGNEILQWTLKSGKLGGRVAVYLDDEKINEFNMYSESAKTDKVILKRGLSQGAHVVKVEFLGAIEGIDYEDKPAVMYVQTDKSDVLNLTAVLEGKEVYHFYDEYKSPTAYDTYSFREAPTVYADKVTSKEELTALMIEQIKDVPTVEVTTNYINYAKIKENSKVRLVHKPMGFNTDLEVVGLKKFHPSLQKKAEVTFANNRTDILNYQRRLNRAISQMNIGGY